MGEQTVGAVATSHGMPRLELVPARCAVGISKSGAGHRVVHRMSGKELGIVAKPNDSGRNIWRFYLESGVESIPFTSPDEAAEALADYVLDCALARQAWAVGLVDPEQVRRVEEALLNG